MITRWQEIAKRTAIALDLPNDVVEEAILSMAEKTIEHLINPKVIETDCFGIGVLETRFGKLQKRIEVLHRIIKIKQMYVDKYILMGTEQALEKKEKYLKDIAVIEKNILTFEEFLRIKEEVYKKGGRQKWTKEIMDETGLRRTQFGPILKKIKLSETYQGPGRKKRKKKEVVDDGKPKRQKKRRARRVRGWIPPQDRV